MKTYTGYKAFQYIDLISKYRQYRFLTKFCNKNASKRKKYKKNTCVQSRRNVQHTEDLPVSPVVVMVTAGGGGGESDVGVASRNG